MMWHLNVSGRGDWERCSAAEVMSKVMTPFTTCEVGIRPPRWPQIKACHCQFRPLLPDSKHQTVPLGKDRRPPVLKLSSRIFTVCPNSCTSHVDIFSLTKPGEMGWGERICSRFCLPSSWRIFHFIGRHLASHDWLLVHRGLPGIGWCVGALQLCVF